MRHARCARGEVCLGYPAKSGRRQTRALVDEPAYGVVHALLRRRGGGRAAVRVLGGAGLVHRPLVVERFEEGVTVAPALGRLGEDGGFGHPATRGAVERAVPRLLR
ncbi:hypothetical protein ACIGN6_16980 [Streptomyces sp. NPDC053792]|uniref:hypothetical protein n=1 Tax=Streptomyces sp. NPDC053792 TaxID=3365716 RepID=UPI0037D72F9C